MKTHTRSKGGAGEAPVPGARKPRDLTVRDDTAIRDESGRWAAGLTNEAQAGRLGRMVALMPQVDELMADLFTRLTGGAEAGRDRAFRAAGAERRIAMLRAIAGNMAGSAAEQAEFDAVVGDYAAARGHWTACLHGLWYTHDNGRTFLAVPDEGGAATFLVAREVKPAELVAALRRLDGLGRALPRLGRGPRRPSAAKTVRRRRPVPGKEGRAAPKGEAALPGRRARRWAAPSPAAPTEPGEGKPGEG